MTTDRIDELKKRAHRCVCKNCGSPLELRRIIYGNIEDARVEIFCSECGKIEFGIEPEIYAVAKYFVEELNYNAFPDMEESEKTKQMSIAKVGEIIAWAYKNMGYLNADGFVYPPKTGENILGESIVITDGELDKMLIKDVEANHI